MNYVLDNFFNGAVLTVSMESEDELREWAERNLVHPGHWIVRNP